MSFLNATLLAGMLAAAVPVVLHLLARQQPRHVVFPGVAFLKNKVTAQKSRMRIRRWWLLALRVLAVIAFALVLARPHIDSTMSTAWTTIGLIGVAGVGLLAMASVAFSKNGSRWLAWSLLVASVVAWLVAGVGAISSLANSTAPSLAQDQPVAIAIVIDNSPGLSWRTDLDAGDIETSNASSGTSSITGSGSTRLGQATLRANELINRLASGSRLAVIDRSGSPVGFSLDVAAARTRLSRLKPLASPAPIADRIDAAIELVRTSDLPDRHVVVVTDLAQPTWDVDVPLETASSRFNEQRRDGVGLSILSLRPDAGLSSESGLSAGGTDQRTPEFNRYLSLPRFVDSTPAPGVAIPVLVDVGAIASASKASAQAAGGPPIETTATVELSLYEKDPALPVVRDGEVVTPDRRTVDRASVSIQAGQSTEVVLTLPPLPRGDYHAVIELVGEDQFEWDNRRYLTVDLPEATNVLLVGDHREETGVVAAAMTAPHDVDDPAASYRIDQVTYRDLTAVDWRPFDLVMMVDPPVRYDTDKQEWAGSGDGLSDSMLEQVRALIARGGGLWIGLGPNSEVLPGAGNGNGLGPAAGTSRPLALVPPLARIWRVPKPGTFLQIENSSHPIFEPLSRPSTTPNWSDFRIRRYWQTEPNKVPNKATEPDGWRTLARYADRDASGSHAAVLVREVQQGRIVVMTTPLPALSSSTRSWNDLFGGSDAWPAFMTTRSIAAWLSGRQHAARTLMVGQTAMLGLPEQLTTAIESSTQNSSAKGADDTPISWKLYPPDQLQMDVRVNLDQGGQQSLGNRPSIIVNDTGTPGTYFLRSFGLADDESAVQVGLPSGFSANLAMDWSRDAVVDNEVLAKWFGEPGDGESFQVVDSVDALSLATGGGASAVSMHGPLMLLAVILFLAEQLLSNRFYGNQDRSQSTLPAFSKAT
ncbi:BatA domain-containing protein [Neorhodopirellula lusitana]|uniref:BatA domain-containing protein n=1 Tax=Neorhodopirellula lusitana TaxID=445327 RepID=UPI00384EBEAA